MNGCGESPTFALFCTVDDGDCYLFAEVADEIEAVEAFHYHVAGWGPDHVPFIHMEPMREQWRDDCLQRTGETDVDRGELDLARNLFRAPAESTS